MSKCLEKLEQCLQAATGGAASFDALVELAWHIKAFDPQRGIALSENAIVRAKKSRNASRIRSASSALGTCLCYLARVDEGKHVLVKNLASSRRAGEHRTEARTLLGLGLAYCMKSEMKTAREHLEMAADIFAKDDDTADLASCFNALGGSFRETSDYSMALCYLDKARQLREQMEDITGLAATLINIGNIYWELGDHKKALEFHQRSLRAYQKTNFQTPLCRTLVCLAVDYSGLKQFEKAIEVGLRAWTMAVELQHKIFQVSALINLGHCYMCLGNFVEAEKSCRQALMLARTGNDLLFTCDALNKLGNLLCQRRNPYHDPIEARQLLTECVAIGEAIKQLRLTSLAHQRLAELYQEEGNFETALQHYQQYHELHEKVFTEDADKRSKLLFIQMEVEKAQQEAEIHRLKTVELAVSNASLAEANVRLEGLATTDALTGLANHRAMVAALDLELERCHRYAHTCTILFLDIDHFKTLNDSYGHPVGDAVLREFAVLVQSCLRGPDMLGRWGGEEFVALLPETHTEGARLLAERVRAATASHVFEAAGGLHLTCSVGVAESPAHGDDRDTLIAAADQAVYAAKRLGRNQVRLADDPAVMLLTAAAESGREGVALLGTVQALAALVAARDSYTGKHNEAVGIMAMRLALVLGLDAAGAHQIGLAARLHDIGKVGIADMILYKPSRLTAEEWEKMRQHPAIGADVVSHVPGLRPLATLIRSHHERWDGSGYPDGLPGEAIPFGARIVAVADAWRAMTSDRPYRAAQCQERARAELRRGAGTQFDPSVVEAFLNMPIGYA